MGGIYKRLATIVASQEEVAIRIDENMDATLDNVDGAHKELLKYFENISGNRWLIIKIFLFLIIFSIFFAVFVA